MPFCVRLHLIASIFFAALLQTCTIANAEPMKDFSAARRCFVENPGQGVVINGYRYLISKHIFDINDNINESIANIYGQNARIADWVELSKLNFSDLNELADGIGLSRQTSRRECFNLFVSVDDALSPDGKNRYLIARHNGIIPSQWTSLAQLGHNFINLGRWTSRKT